MSRRPGDGNIQSWTRIQGDTVDIFRPSPEGEVTVLHERSASLALLRDGLLQHGLDDSDIHGLVVTSAGVQLLDANAKPVMVIALEDGDVARRYGWRVHGERRDLNAMWPLLECAQIAKWPIQGQIVGYHKRGLKVDLGGAMALLPTKRHSFRHFENAKRVNRRRRFFVITKLDAGQIVVRAVKATGDVTAKVAPGSVKYRQLLEKGRTSSKTGVTIYKHYDSWHRRVGVKRNIARLHNSHLSGHDAEAAAAASATSARPEQAAIAPLAQAQSILANLWDGPAAKLGVDADAATFDHCRPFVETALRTVSSENLVVAAFAAAHASDSETTEDGRIAALMMAEAALARRSEPALLSAVHLELAQAMYAANQLHVARLYALAAVEAAIDARRPVIALAGVELLQRWCEPPPIAA